MGVAVKLKKSGEIDSRGLTKDQILSLEDLFFMNGITVYKAHKRTGIDKATVEKYFSEWADTLVKQQEETWSDRHKRVRARALEGLADKLIIAQERRVGLMETYNELQYTKTTDKDGKETLVRRALEDIDHDTVIAYENKIQTLDKHILDIDTEFTTIDSSPPPDVVLMKELGIMIGEYNETGTISSAGSGTHYPKLPHTE